MAAAVGGGVVVGDQQARLGQAIAVIVPVHNGAEHIEAALRSIAAQTHNHIQVCVHDDASTDGTWELLISLQTELTVESPDRLLTFRFTRSTGKPQRAGAARNAAVEASSAPWLALLDADDTMAPERLQLQLAAAEKLPELCLVGSGIARDPPDATHRYTAWANSLSDEDLQHQRYRECTLLAPTWFMPRALFTAVGGMPSSAEDVLQCLTLLGKGDPPFPFLGPPPESQPKRRKVEPAGTRPAWHFTAQQVAGPTGVVPEDLLFFLKAVALGATLYRVPQPLVTYTHRAGSSSEGTPRRVLQRVRAAAFEQQVLSTAAWQGGFYIWGVGRDGRFLYGSLSAAARAKVLGFVDVNPAWTGKTYHHAALRESVPVLHMDDLQSGPIVTAVALHRTEGAFSANLAATAQRLGLQHGKDVWYFI